MNKRILQFVLLSIVLASTFLNYYSGNAMGISIGVSASYFLGGKFMVLMALIGFMLVLKRPKYFFIVGCSGLLVSINYFSGLTFGMEMSRLTGGIGGSLIQNAIDAAFGQVQFGVGLYVLSIISVGILILEYQNLLIVLKVKDDNESNQTYTNHINLKNFYIRNKTVLLITGGFFTLSFLTYITYSLFFKPCDCSLIKWNSELNAYVKNGEIFSGKCNEKNENGEKTSVRFYKNGLRDGLFQYFYDNGNIESEILFVKNHITSRVDFYEHENKLIKYEVKADSMGVYSIRYFNLKSELIVNLEVLSGHCFDVKFDDLIKLLNGKEPLIVDHFFYAKPNSFINQEYNGKYNWKFYKKYKTYELVDSVKVVVFGELYENDRNISGFFLEDPLSNKKICYNAPTGYTSRGFTSFNYKSIQEALNRLTNDSFFQTELFGRELVSTKAEESSDIDPLEN